MKPFFVYMLKCNDKSYYTGHTDNLENRIMQHNHKHFPACFTATRLPVQLVFSEEFNTREEALASERQIKRWSRKKKEALINNDWTLRDGAAHLLRANGKKNLQINRTVVRVGTLLSHRRPAACPRDPAAKSSFTWIPRTSRGTT